MLETAVLKENSLLFTFIVDAQNTKSMIDKQKKLNTNILFTCSPITDNILLFVFLLLLMGTKFLNQYFLVTGMFYAHIS